MLGRLNFEIDTELEPGLVTARAGVDAADRPTRPPQLLRCTASGFTSRSERDS